MVAAERLDEKAVLEATAPRSPVEYTPVGKDGLAPPTGVKVLVETQKALPVASASPFIPLSVALLAVTEVAAFVVTVGATACAIGASVATPVPVAMSASVVTAENTRELIFFIRLVNKLLKTRHRKGSGSVPFNRGCS